MRTHRSWLAAAAFAAGAAAFGLIPAGMTQEARPEPLRIGVVNLKQVVTESGREKDFQIRLGRERKAEEAEIRKIEERMEALMKQIQALVAAGNAPLLLEDKRRELVQLDALRKYRATEWNAEVERRIETHTAGLFNDLGRTIDEVAREAGYDLVMRIETGPIEAGGGVPVNDRIAQRLVLYANPALDITKQVQTRFEPPGADSK